jgi:hypothetical protein
VKKLGLLFLACATLAACGGGSDSPAATAPAATDSPAPSTTAIPKAVVSAGTYFTYTSTTTPVLPSTGAVTQSVQTRFILNDRAPDGSYTRTDTIETSGTQTRVINNAQEITSYNSVQTANSSGVSCTSDKPIVAGPRPGSEVGQDTTSTLTETCTYTSANIPTTTFTSTETLSNKGIESITTPAGTFRAMRYTLARTSTSSGIGVTSTTTTSTGQGWIDMTTGRLVKAETESKSGPAGSTTITSARYNVFQLEGYAIGGVNPTGNVTQRFAGQWTVAFSGNTTGDCASGLKVAANGAITGTCRFVQNATLTNFEVSGSVGADGTASFKTTTGAIKTITGTFASPTKASGTWTDGSLSGSWSAIHQ